MSRLSWASSGSDAEVQHHFDQPFDYDHRHGWSQNEEQEEQNDSEHSGHEGKAHFDESADAVSLNESHNSSDVEPIHSQDPHPDTSTSRQDPLDDANDQSNQAICRICLDSSSSDASGGESLGRLLSPCRCKGTMKYVHATCLDQWRAASARSSSAVACDQCGAPYRFRKSKFVGLATSPTLLFIVSLFLFLLLIWTVGLVATFCMDLYDKPAPLKSTSRRGRFSRWWPWSSSSSDQEAGYPPLQTDAWSYLDADYTSPGIWSYGTLMYEPAAYIKLIKEAVRSFSSGEAVDAVREVVGLQDTDAPQQLLQQEAEDDQRGFWSALKYEWMYGDGGLWQQKSSSPSQTATIPQQIPSLPNGGVSETEAAKAKPREKYDARAASDANDVRARQRRRQRAAKSARRFAPAQAESKGILGKLLIQFSVGFSLVGILSFVNLLVGASFLGPINLHNFGLGRSFARMTSGGRGGGGRNGNRDGVNIASILIVLLVLIGVIRALHVVYKLVKKGARRGLSRLEAVIVDWNHDDDDALQGAQEFVRVPDAVLVEEDRDVRRRQAFVHGEID